MNGQTSKEKSQEKAVIARKELKRRRIMSLFILSTEQLLREDGMRNLTIRKIADVTGYSSAALYSYFTDINELILYASFKYRKEYLQQVAKEITPDMTSLEQYRRIYEIFNSYAFRNPDIFVNLYFGKHSENLKEVASEYYHLFPEEFVAPTELIRNLLLQGRLIDCDKVTTPKLAEDGYIRPENVDVVAELMVRMQETFIYDMMMNPHKDPKEQNAQFMRLFDHIIATN